MKRFGIGLVLGALACGKGTEPLMQVAPMFSGLVMQNCMVQITTAHLILDEVDSGAVGLAAAQRNGAATTCTNSRVYHIAAGTHHTVVQGTGTCSGAVTALDQQRPFPGKDTTWVGISKGNC